jgi:hypothetical protein
LIAPPIRNTFRQPMASSSTVPAIPIGRAAVEPTRLKIEKTLPRLSGG